MSSSTLEQSLAFLAREQEPPGSPSAGAWRSQVCRGTRVRSDCNAFVTALIVQTLAPLERRERFDKRRRSKPVARMQASARAFLRTCRAAEPVGAFTFWSAADPHFHARADLDDTALVRTVLRDADAGHLDASEALRIFGPYRALRGTPLAAPSRWAESFPGLFVTWLQPGRAVIDLAVNANIVGYLRSIGADVPGLSEAEAAIDAMLESDASLENVAPYYPSLTTVLWRFAHAASSGARFAPALRRRLNALAHEYAHERPHMRERAQRRHLDHGDALVLVAAYALAGVSTPEGVRRAGACCPMSPDGGRPAVRVCTDLIGRTVWSSRSLGTALAIACGATAPAAPSDSTAAAIGSGPSALACASFVPQLGAASASGAPT